MRAIYTLPPRPADGFIGTDPLQSHPYLQIGISDPSGNVFGLGFTTAPVATLDWGGIITESTRVYGAESGGQLAATLATPVPTSISFTASGRLLISAGGEQIRRYNTDLHDTVTSADFKAMCGRACMEVAARNIYSNGGESLINQTIPNNTWTEGQASSFVDHCVEALNNQYGSTAFRRATDLENTIAPPGHTRVLVKLDGSTGTYTTVGVAENLTPGVQLYIGGIMGPNTYLKWIGVMTRTAGVGSPPSYKQCNLAFGGRFSSTAALLSWASTTGPTAMTHNFYLANCETTLAYLTDSRLRMLTVPSVQAAYFKLVQLTQRGMFATDVSDLSTNAVTQAAFIAEIAGRPYAPAEGFLPFPRPLYMLCRGIGVTDWAADFSCDEFIAASTFANPNLLSAELSPGPWIISLGAAYFSRASSFYMAHKKDLSSMEEEQIQTFASHLRLNPGYRLRCWMSPTLLTMPGGVIGPVPTTTAYQMYGRAKAAAFHSNDFLSLQWTPTVTFDQLNTKATGRKFRGLALASNQPPPGIYKVDLFHVKENPSLYKLLFARGVLDPVTLVFTAGTASSPVLIILQSRHAAAAYVNVRELAPLEVWALERDHTYALLTWTGDASIGAETPLSLMSSLLDMSLPNREALSSPVQGLPTTTEMRLMTWNPPEILRAQKGFPDLTGLSIDEGTRVQCVLLGAPNTKVMDEIIITAAMTVPPIGFSRE